MNSRIQDFALVVGGLQRIARSSTKYKQTELRNLLNSFPSIQEVNVPKSVEKLNTISAADLTKKSALVVENSFLFSQALANLVAKDLSYKSGPPLVEDDGRKYTFVEYQDVGDEREDNVEVYSETVLNPKLSSLDIIELVDDLTSPDEIKKTAFITTVKRRTVEPIRKSKDEPNLEQKLKFKPHQGASPLALEPPKSRLSSDARERAVPSTRIGRLASFGGLGIGLGIGVVAEASKRMIGLSKSKQSDALLDGSLLLNEANAERIVHTLCKVRGAALKLGQMLSIQDDSMMTTELSKIFERVRQSADFMPLRQLEKVLKAELGPDWRSKHFDSFEDQPFAAASIGQVHVGRTKSGQNVAVKIQYPGVADGIESDINNLLGVLKVANILPERMFIDKIVEHMKIELSQECDYVREAECCRRMRKLLEPYPEFYVPKVIDELTTKQVFTTELISGLTIDQCAEIEDQETRDYITLIILELLLRELFIFRYMQTDPNWANFLYNPHTKQLGLLDFGATREYRPFFVNNYFKIIEGAANDNRDQVLEYSRKVGFLTGYESKIMNDAHVESVMILAEAFRMNSNFDFGKQKTTARMQEMVSVMLQHRLCAPPPEVYSLHRKMSGLFLLASKLGANINCFHVWRRIASEFRVHPEEN